MIFPIGDDNSQRRSVPLMTWGLVALNTLVGYFQLTIGDTFTYALTLVPWEISNLTDLVEPVEIAVEGEMFSIPHFPSGVPLVLTLFSSMFLHGSFAHYAGNMLYLLIFGDQVEDQLGKGKFILFYLMAGVVAAFAHIGVDTESPIHMLGASGAIAGLLGAYLIYHPANRITVFFFFTTIRLPAVLVIGIWFFGQLSGVTSSQPVGIAYMAHVGGFLGGILLLFFLVRRKSENTA